MKLLILVSLMCLCSTVTADLRVGIASKSLTDQDVYYILKCDHQTRCISAAMVDRAIYVEDLRTNRVIKGILRPTETTSTTIDFCSLSAKLRLVYRSCDVRTISEASQ
jgi:hypothetical protein